MNFITERDPYRGMVSTESAAAEVDEFAAFLERSLVQAREQAHGSVRRLVR